MIDAAVNYVLTLSRKMGQDDCTGLAGEMAYNLILSMIPMIIFLTSLAGLAGGQQEVFPLAMDFIRRLAPAHTTGLLLDTFQAIVHGSSAGLTVIGLLGSLWSASGVGGVIIKGLQRAFGLEGRKFPFWYSYWLSLLIVLSLGGLLIVATYLILFGDFLLRWLTARLHLQADMLLLLSLVRWGVAIVGLHGATAFIYGLVLRPRAGRLAWRTVYTGSWFFVLGWLVLSLLFSLYIDRLHQFNPVYGAMGVVILLVTWLYYSSLVFFIGGEMTALRAMSQTAGTGRA